MAASVEHDDMNAKAVGECSPEEAAEQRNMDLMTAARECNLEKVRELLAAGASAAFIHDPPGVWGSCSRKGPLHEALAQWPRRPLTDESVESHKERYVMWKAVVQALIDKKADVNAVRDVRDWRGSGTSSTAFEMALAPAMQDAELLELFLGAGGNANTQSVRSHHSMRTDGTSGSYVLHEAVCKGDLEVVRALLDAGAKVDAIAFSHLHNERGYNQHTDETALHQACKKQDLAMVALLLARGADVNMIRKHLEQVRQEAGSPTADPRDPDFIPDVTCVPVSETALHIALRNCDSDLTTLLVCAGADVTCARQRGEERTACEELCGDNEALLKALNTVWTPETHKFFPQEVRESVEAALMIAKRQKWPLPETVLFDICRLAVSA